MRCSASFPSRVAASLMICNLRSTAATAMGLERKASKSMPEVNWSIIAIAFTMSLNQRSGGGLKDKNRLALRSFKHLGAKHLSVGQVGFDAEDIGKAVFEVGPPDEGQLPGPVEVGDNIYIRCFTDCRSPRIGAVQQQMLDASGLQFLLILPQFGDDCGCVHVSTLFYILPHACTSAGPPKLTEDFSFHFRNLSNSAQTPWFISAKLACVELSKS